MIWLPVILIVPYVILILKNYSNLHKLETFKLSSEPKTFISIVVACRNEQKNLPSLLTNIALQNYPKELFEVIVVNDRSTDKTFEIASAVSAIGNIHSINNNGKGKKQALRTGIKAAKGDLILTTDADCRMGMNWIRTIAGFYEMNKPDMIICPVQIESVKGFFGRFQELEFLSLQGITAGSALSEGATMCNGANLAFTREVYFHHSDNLHDEINSGDDIFLLHCIKEENLSKIMWLESSDALVTTEAAATLRSFLRQRSRWLSKGKVYTDKNTVILGVFSFIAIILQLSYFIGLLFYPALLSVFLVILILKSIPDFLLLLNTTKRYGRKKLMWWFLPSQVIYPFYVITVVSYSLIFTEKKKINSPFPKET